ncbi:cytochrome c oxidase assembly protein [Paenibacillus puerhi]|uniref:cytochrome c oxidase assembly protein n=1 Tax=Paenibacillus puerhi TaxID=2692622 RepID=UPI00135C153A|nr:cytochrome c oxidase assembly protein [Paenibacillus puerhi]
MNQTHLHASSHGFEEHFYVVMLLGALSLLLYAYAAILSNRRYSPWPPIRYFLWFAGNLSAVAASAGPLAAKAHLDFTAHMIGHLLLGMLAPLLLVLAAPMTLMLRVLPLGVSRRLARFHRSAPIRVLCDPATASILNVGGLVVLYTTSLYMWMQQSVALHLLVHVHVFLAGCLFTVALIGVDPTPHRTSRTYRGIVLIVSLAAHGLLSKYIYAHPPAGVPAAQAETGGMVMYYGGDVIDAVLIFMFFYQGYKSGRAWKAQRTVRTTDGSRCRSEGRS